MIVEGMELKALGLDQENPYTMVKVSHANNGVIYTACGWALWDGKEKWSDNEGIKIALKRAKRKIARRLEWERNRYILRLVASQRISDTQDDMRVLSVQMEAVHRLHRDGGTVRL